MSSMLKKAVRSWLALETENATPELPKGFVPMGSFDPADIFIIGFPKSGHTWMQNLVAETIYGFSADTTPAALVNDLVPDIHFCKLYKRYLRPMFFKAHALPAPELKRVIYLLRDGRDAMVSYLHYSEAMERRQIDFLHMVRSGEGLFPCKWHEHVSKWLANPFGADILQVRYEDLKRDPVSELKRICGFAGLKRDDAQLERAAARCAFERMQQREKISGIQNPDWPKDRLFTRRGEVGSYKSEMPAEVQEAFMNEAGEVMRRLGYAEV